MHEPVRVEIPTTDGVTLRGDFFQADAERAPAVAMSAGLTLLKEHAVGTLARQFQAAGISALAYDHRSFGSSDGEPRQETNPIQHAEDYHDAAPRPRGSPRRRPRSRRYLGPRPLRPLGHDGRRRPQPPHQRLARVPRERLRPR